MAPSGSWLPHLGQGMATPLCLALGHLLGVSVGSWDGFAPLPLLWGCGCSQGNWQQCAPCLQGWVGGLVWRAPQWVRRAGPPGLQGCAARSGSPSLLLCLAHPGVQGPSGAPVSPLGGGRGPWLRDGAVSRAPWANSRLSAAGKALELEGAGAPLCLSPPQRPHLRGTLWGMPWEERSTSQGLCQPWMGSSSASSPQHSSFLWAGLRLHGEPKPLGLGVNGGCR